MVTNARSLAPKIQSMIDNFSELDLNVAIVAESWLKPGESLEREINDLSEGENIGIIHKSRKTRKGRNAGGGIAILFNKTRMKLKERKIKRGNAELVCAAGKLPNHQRNVVIFGIYIPPSTRAKQLRCALELLSDGIGQAKLDYNCRNRCKFLNIDSLSHRLVVGLFIKAIQTL